MARIRSIKPEVRTSLVVAGWPREVRYFWVLLWGYLDDKGHGVDDSRLIKADCFPLDDDVNSATIDEWLSTISGGPREDLAKIPPDDEPPLCRYSVGGRRYLHALNWTEHQRPSHPKPSKIPKCHRHEGGSGDSSQANTTSGNPPEDLAKPSGDAPEDLVPEQVVREGSREQVVREGSRSGESRGGPPETAHEQRPDGLTAIPDEFALSDAMRRTAAATFPQLDADFETAQFISHYRSTGARRRNWFEQWQKWMRDSAKRLSERALRAAPAARPSTTDQRVAQAQALKALYPDDGTAARPPTIRGEITG